MTGLQFWKQDEVEQEAPEPMPEEPEPAEAAE